jgi:hypothetical protein
MSLNLKQAADELLKVADEIEKEAAEVTCFVCDKCNHTATLSTINAKRQETAKTAGENVVVADISVNDKIHCPACDGVMGYRETEASKQYYFEPKAAEGCAPGADTDEGTDGKKKEEPVNYDE